MKLFNPIRFFYFHLLLLQLEEYDLGRYLIALKNTRGVPPTHPFRKPLKFTTKIGVIIVLTCLLTSLTTIVLKLGNFVSLALFIALSFYFSYLFLIIILLMLLPFDLSIKELLIFLAKNKVRSCKKLKIIGVAGSYGKTGMKDIVATILAEKYQVLKTPESVNTPLGIANLIINKLTPEVEILIVEMGEYYRGDIKRLCQITPPDIAVITGINEAHLERLKTIDNTISTIFEIAQSMKNHHGLLLLNGRDKLIGANYKKYLAGQRVYFYKTRGKVIFNENLPGYVVNNIPLPILGQYNLDKIDGTIYLAKYLNLSEEEINRGLKKITTPAHRLQPILNHEKNILVIDDSYNGNPDGVEEAIHTLSLFKKRRKIFVTPGLVEIGSKTQEIHQRIGIILNDVVDIVVLVKNSATPDIEKGLIKSDFDKKNIRWFPSMYEAQKALSDMIKPNDVVLFQNDWPDNYV